MLKHVKTNSMKACNMAECTNLLHHKPITLFQLTLLGPRHLWGAVVLLTCPLVLPGATSARFWIHSSDRTAIRIKLGHIPNVQGKSYYVYLYICISVYLCILLFPGDPSCFGLCAGSAPLIGGSVFWAFFVSSSWLWGMFTT